jgi:hypothetical protein
MTVATTDQVPHCQSELQRHSAATPTSRSLYLNPAKARFGLTRASLHSRREEPISPATPVRHFQLGPGSSPSSTMVVVYAYAHEANSAVTSSPDEVDWSVGMSSVAFSCNCCYLANSKAACAPANCCGVSPAGMAKRRQTESSGAFSA